MRTISLADAEALVVEALLRSNVSDANARPTARALVGAEAIGQTGHGLRRVAAYAAQARTGKVDGRAAPRMARAAPGVLHVDAARGFAYPALDLAITELPVVAAEQGVAIAAVRRSHHCGAMGLDVERLADAGVVALMLANTPAAMAAPGGRAALLGTNPIAFAAPGPDGPVVVDLALSQVARGKVMAARQKGEPIPQGWALDRQGRPTTDPGTAIEGTMAPLGGAKGAALALVVEALAGGLVGARLAFEASSFLEAEGPAPETGQLMLVLNVRAVGGEAGVAGLARLFERIDAEEGARLPGSRRRALREEAQRNGLAVDEAVIDEIASLSGSPVA